MADKSLDPMPIEYSEVLRKFLISRGVWHRFIEFDDPVKTVEQAAQRVEIEKIANSIILIDSDRKPLMVILQAKNRISYKKLKVLLSVRDVRLADEKEVLEQSGFPAGGVPPFNNVTRVFLDPSVLKNPSAIVGGGDINKLIEVRTKDILDVVKPILADVIA